MMEPFKEGTMLVGRIVAVGHGGPEALEWSAVDVGDPGRGEIRVRHAAIGVNFIDVYFRKGIYPTPSAPFPLGSEASGVVEAVGPDVYDVKVGDHVAYAGGALGAYSEARIVPAESVVVVPKGISHETAAAMMLKGMTAEYLLHRTVAVHPGDAVVVHAAAGGVGLILCQWAKHLGATVIGTVGSEEKAALARDNGAHHTILYKDEDVAARVREITHGKGARVVYDSVGKDTFEASLDSLGRRGMLVLFGQSSGRVEEFDPQVLNQKGSLFLTRPTLAHYTGTREELQLSAGRLFQAVQSGAVKIRVSATFPLREAARAHVELEARRTTGSIVLLP